MKIAWVPKYTSEADIERVVQFDITASTKPSSSETLDIIEQVEKEIDARKLGWKDGGIEGDGYDITNLYIDVPEAKEEITPIERIKGEYAVKVLLHGYPILAMVSLERRTSDELSDTPAWESLTQGYYEGWTEGPSDYMLIMDKGKDGQRYGIGFYFYSSKLPLQGKASLKASFSYSYNIPSSILKEYATLKAAIEVLKASVTAGEPTRITTYPGGDMREYVPREMERQINQWRLRIKEIEADHFPEVSSGSISL